MHMTDEIIRTNIAGRITRYRKQLGLTQSELSEKINYSDKSISKWERGEGVPDVQTLVQLSEIFGVTVNDLIYPQTILSKPQVKNTNSTVRRATMHHYFISILAIVGVWLAAFLTICLFRYLAPALAAVWSVRIVCYASACCFVTWLVLAALWWPRFWCFSSITGIIWCAALSIHQTFSVSGAGMVYAAAGILQLLLLVCYFWLCAAEHRWILPQLFPTE